MTNKTIIFDWNGTLLADTQASWKAANACLEFYGRPPITLEQYRETFHFPVMHFYVRNGCSVDEILARKDEGNDLFHNTYENLVKNSRTRRGARSVLSWLAQNNISAMILSNYLIPRIEHQLERLDIRHYFDHVCAHNDDGTTVLQSTTKVDRLKATIDKRGLNPADMLIIGDSLEEPEIGRALGITSVSITAGYISEKRLAGAGADHTIHNLLELQPLLAEKWGLPHRA